MAQWHPDTHIDAELAQRLLRSEVPAVMAASVVPFGEGWDNAAFLVDDTWVFRFPKRRIAADFMHAEMAVLCALPQLSLPIPRPIHTVVDTAYGYPYAGYRLLDGQTGDRAIAPPASVEHAAIVGQFVRELHATQPPPGTPADELDRSNLAARAARLLAQIEAISPLAPQLPWDGVHGLLARAAETEPPPHVLIHGDLYPRHVLIDGGQPSAVIDWGDVHVGDPCKDLSIAWTWFDGPGRAAFFRAYDPDQALPMPLITTRARFHAAQYGFFLLPYAEETSDGALRAVALHAISQAVDAT